MTVIVVGAGVIGLTSALVLAEKGHKVTVVAETLPSDPLKSSYTSAWAGAHYRPFPSVHPHDQRESKYTRQTLEWFEELAVVNPESSVKFVTGEEYIESANEYYKNVSPGYSEGIKDFEVLDPAKVKRSFPGKIDFACKYKTWVLNPPLYLAFLVRQLTMNHHVKMARARFNSLEGVFLAYPDAKIVVNATGQGLQMEGGYDPKSFPIRGQTLLIRPPKKDHPYKDKTITYQGADGKWTFVIPRPLDGGVIVGGTKQVNAVNDSPDPMDTKDLTERARVIFPELFVDGKLDIVRTNVGFRPGRKNGSRIGIEKFTDTKYIVHAYGVGGMGYEVSYGVAQSVVQLIDSFKSKL